MNIRSKIENRRTAYHEPKDTGPGVFYLVCLLSVLCHAIFFISLFFLYDFEFCAPQPRVVTVDLVSFAPGPAANTQTLEKPSKPEKLSSDNGDKVNPDAISAIPSQPVEPKRVEIPILKPDVSLKSKPDNLKDLIAARPKEKPKEKPKKKPPKENLVEKKKKEEQRARKKQAAKLENQKKAQLKNAFERMKASVASKEKGPQGTSSGGNGAAGGQGVGEASLLTRYQYAIKSAIEQNWIFNDAMAGLDQDLKVIIFIKILKSGDIRDISFETRSGNNYLDESAKKAVQRANPLPELPKGMSSYELVLGFSPRGLK